MRKALLLALLAALAYAQVVGWHPPWALVVSAYPVNATHFTTTLPQYGYLTVYVVQDGLAFRGTPEELVAIQQMLYQVCKYVAVDPRNITVGEYAAYVVADVYCSPDGARWALLKWLALRFSAYSANVTMVPANLTAYTPLGNFSGSLPEGWYADLQARYVFRLPGGNYSAVEWYYARVGELGAQLEKLKRELENKTALVKQLSAQTEELRKELDRRGGQIAELQAKLDACREQLRNATSARRQLEDEVERLRGNVGRLMAELNATREQLRFCLAQLQSSAAAEEGGGGPAIPPYAAMALVLLAVAAGYIVYKKRMG